MSKVRLDLVWQHHLVLPYILGDLKKEIDQITPVKQILLYGSRSKTAVENWDSLQGKDWDIIVVTNFPITNTKIWTYERKYHIDLQVINELQAEKLTAELPNIIELYPNNQLSRKGIVKRILSKLKKWFLTKFFRKNTKSA